LAPVAAPEKVGLLDDVAPNGLEVD
jgi:hypothetical protein